MKRILFALSIVLTLVGCRPDSDDDNTGINTNIEFMPVELYESDAQGTPFTALRIATTNNYPCSNYNLVTTQQSVNGELTVRFKRIDAPTNCVTTPGPAQIFVAMPTNTTKIIFKNGQIIDTYHVAITAQKVIITPEVTNFTESLHTTTFRYPQNTFAYVCGTSSEDVAIYNEFLNILQSNPAFTEYIFEDDGRIPYAETSSGHEVNHPSKYFKYNNTSDFNTAGQLLENFTTQHITPNSGTGIWLQSWDNRNYMSWEFQ